MHICVTNTLCHYGTEIAIALGLSDEDLFCMLDEIVGNSTDGKFSLLVEIFNYLLMRYSQTILSPTRLSSRIACALAAVIKVFRLKPESIAAVLFSLKVPNEELRMMLLWDLPVRDDMLGGVVLHFKRRQHKLTSWDERVISRCAFAREMVHTARGMELLRQVDWGNYKCSNDACVPRVRPSTLCMGTSNPSSTSGALQFMASHETKEQAVRSLIQLQLDSEKLPRIIPDAPWSYKWDLWKAEFCARIWMELVAKDLVSPSNLAKVFAQKANESINKYLEIRAQGRVPWGGLSSLVRHWDTFTEAEEVSSVDRIKEQESTAL
ncbi:hypothetical protein M427DRAFT_48493 [Gonapodya prolifera JEL478]|uniref:Uncharacterized protein n=1 Tax=Gonapodya prolifera (strain JEL478) TaxID=1344416 RepID=A0A139A0E3_GONPJ|nr:hypothetical protein M427DRAFT_48493 [Gonapodya prolifera JEL478]|eukprot:KXS10202.1 hypothetical protein M427DRAFT_48493 [Gonapodya prolifera JEL478]